MKKGIEQGRREGMEQGMRKGMRQGRKEGLQKGLRETVLRMLFANKFTKPPSDTPCGRGEACGGKVG